MATAYPIQWVSLWMPNVPRATPGRLGRDPTPNCCTQVHPRSTLSRATPAFLWRILPSTGPVCETLLLDPKSLKDPALAEGSGRHQPDRFVRVLDSRPPPASCYQNPVYPTSTTLGHRPGASRPPHHRRRSMVEGLHKVVDDRSVVLVSQSTKVRVRSLLLMPESK